MTRCDAGCRRHTITTWWYPDTDQTLDMCGVCSDRHAIQLVIQEWVNLVDQRTL